MSDSKLTFTERNTGWDVQTPTLAFNTMGERLHTIGFLSQQYDTKEEWRFYPASEDSLSLRELDQIRHKMANLEQLRLLEAAKEQRDAANRLANEYLNKEKSNGKD